MAGAVTAIRPKHGVERVPSTAMAIHTIVVKVLAVAWQMYIAIGPMVAGALLIAV